MAGETPGAHAEGETRDEQEQEVAQAREEASGGAPHGELSEPARDPDPTEHPDPYERRPDPRDPAAVDTPADPADEEVLAERDAAPQDPSTSDPHPPRNIDERHYGGDER